MGHLPSALPVSQGRRDISGTSHDGCRARSRAMPVRDSAPRPRRCLALRPRIGRSRGCRRQAATVMPGRLDGFSSARIYGAAGIGLCRGPDVAASQADILQRARVEGCEFPKRLIASPPAGDGPPQSEQPVLPQNRRRCPRPYPARSAGSASEAHVMARHDAYSKPPAGPPGPQRMAPSRSYLVMYSERHQENCFHPKVPGRQVDSTAYP